MKIFAIKTTFSDKRDVQDAHMHRILFTPAETAEEAVANFESFQNETISMPGKEAIDVSYVKEIDQKDFDQFFAKYFEK